MSTPAATKYTDYYAVLGVEPKATSEEIAASYQTLAKRFHPSTAVTGDKAKFAEVTEAYETLADPSSREAFDEIRKKNTVDTTPPAFTGPAFFSSFAGESARRMTVLCVLYDRRRQKPFTPSLSMRQLEAIMRITSEDLNFALWYLKQRGFVVSDDKSSLQVTIDGMDYLETHLPSYDDIEPHLRPQEEFEAITNAQKKPEPKPAAQPDGPESAGKTPVKKDDYAGSSLASLAELLRSRSTTGQVRR